MTGGNLDPGYFINPPAFTYLLAGWLSVLHLGGDVQQLFATDPGQVFLDARVLSAIFGVGAAALAGPGRDWRRAAKGLALAAGVAALVVVATNPYMFSDWGTFTHDLSRQRKFADGDALIGQVERNGWSYYARSLGWALGL